MSSSRANTAACSKVPGSSTWWSTMRRRDLPKSWRLSPARLVKNRAEFLAMFSDADLNYLVDRWAMKIRFCRDGDMKWGIYLASKARG